MRIVNNKIELTEEERSSFELHMQRGMMLQLYKEKMLTNEQLKQVLKSIEE